MEGNEPFKFVVKTFISSARHTADPERVSHDSKGQILCRQPRKCCRISNCNALVPARKPLRSTPSLPCGRSPTGRAPPLYALTSGLQTHASPALDQHPIRQSSRRFHLPQERKER